MPRAEDEQTELPKIDQATFGYQPLLLGAAALGFIVAGQSAGGLSPAGGAGIGFAVVLGALFAFEKLVLGGLFDDMAVLRRSVLGSESERLSAKLVAATEGLLEHRPGPSRSLPSPEAETDAVAALLKEAERDVLVHHCRSLISKGRLSVTERLFLLACLGRAARTR